MDLFYLVPDGMVILDIQLSDSHSDVMSVTMICIFNNFGFLCFGSGLSLSLEDIKMYKKLISVCPKSDKHCIFSPFQL